MYEKNMKISLLLDFYGDVLPERQHEMLDMYYNDDYSLSEISEIAEISRQGVRFAVKKGEDQLTELEDKLGLLKKFTQMKAESEIIASMLENISDQTENEALKCKINEIILKIKALSL